ncbi:MAG: glycosyltransferase [Bacillota bacterium]
MDIIIYPPTIDWSFMKQRPQHLMQQFADKGYLVFYFNKTQQEKEIEELFPNLFIVHQHDKWLKESLAAVRTKHNSRVGVWCSWSRLVDTMPQYEADWIIYDCVDEFSDWLKFEKEMIAVSSAVVCTAQRIHSRLVREYPDKKIELLRNAYDKNMGLHFPADSPFQAVRKQTVGYIGAWAPWIDDRLMHRLASTLKDTEIVVIGIEFGKRFTLGHLPNVTYLGHLPHDDLAFHLKQFSVCIIPFRITPVTLATNPVKMYEYLATGKPVVSTPLPECHFQKDLIDIGSTHSEFIHKVRTRLADPGSSQERIDFSLNNTWEHRVKQAITLIDSFSKKQ